MQQLNIFDFLEPVSLAHNRIKELCIQYGFKNLITENTLINLYDFTKQLKLMAASQASLYLCNGFCITQVTVLKFNTGEIYVYVDSDTYLNSDYLNSEMIRGYFTSYDSYGYLNGGRQSDAIDFINVFGN